MDIHAKSVDMDTGVEGKFLFHARQPCFFQCLRTPCHKKILKFVQVNWSFSAP